MREAGKSYLWCTEAWFRTKPGTTPRNATGKNFTLVLKSTHHQAQLRYKLKPAVVYD